MDNLITLAQALETGSWVALALGPNIVQVAERFTVAARLEKGSTVVRLRGVAISHWASETPAGATIATLPVGYRPASRSALSESLPVVGAFSKLLRVEP